VRDESLLKLVDILEFAAHLGSETFDCLFCRFERFGIILHPEVSICSCRGKRFFKIFYLVQFYDLVCLVFEKCLVYLFFCFQ